MKPTPNLDVFVVPIFDKDDQQKWCKKCRFKDHPDDRWCYMFKEIVIRCSKWEDKNG